MDKDTNKVLIQRLFDIFCCTVGIITSIYFLYFTLAFSRDPNFSFLIFEHNKWISTSEFIACLIGFIGLARMMLKLAFGKEVL